MALRRTVELSWVQQYELEAHRDHDPRPYVRERCAAVLKIAEGHAAYWVARQGLLKVRDPDTVYCWVTCYQADGLAGLLAHHIEPGIYRWHGHFRDVRHTVEHAGWKFAEVDGWHHTTKA